MVEASAAPSSARDRILIAAERVVVEVGAARLTLELVAQTAAVSKGGLLYHFPSKESLLGALAQRYVDSLEHCVAEAKEGLGESDAGRDLKACILGVLGDDPRSKAMGAVLLAAAMSDLTLLEVIRDCIDRHTQSLHDPGVDFARAAVVSLAIDGLKMRESLRISSFTAAHRVQIVEELLKMTDEAYARRA